MPGFRDRINSSSLVEARFINVSDSAKTEGGADVRYELAVNYILFYIINSIPQHFAGFLRAVHKLLCPENHQVLETEVNLAASFDFCPGMEELAHLANTSFLVL